MTHWFDDLTRTFSRQPLSRRSMLFWTVRLGLASAGAGLLGGNRSTASALGMGLGTGEALDPSGASRAVASAGSTCTVNDSYGVLQARVSVPASSSAATVPLTLTHSFVAEVATGNVLSTLTITADGAAGAAGHPVTDGVTTAGPGTDVVLRMSANSLADHTGRTDVTFGSLYTGGAVSRSSSATDGRVTTGFADGRPLAPAPLGASAQGARFTDGAPAGQAAAVASGMQQAVGDLLQQWQVQAATCATDPQASPVVAACTICQMDCREVWVRCSVGAIDSSLGCGTLASTCYLGSANPTCDAALQVCFQTCKSSGACCPDYCHGDAACCQTSWGCCPPSTHSQHAWSRSWPTCPRCGAPPWTTPSTVQRPDQSLPPPNPLTPTPTPTATLPPTVTPTPTGTPSPGALPSTGTQPAGQCSPRPRVVVQAVPNGDGRLRATLTASANQGFTNALQAITWTNLANATVDVVGGGTASQGQRTALPANTQSVTFLVRRTAAGQAFTVSFSVTDACGDFPTFVGGGTASI
jgi:hypothetical protein